MAGLTLFHYQHRHSLLHRTAPQAKLLLLPLYAVTIVHVSLPGLVTLTLMGALLYKDSGLTLSLFWQEGRVMLFIGLAIFISATFVPFPAGLTVFYEQILTGALRFWRFLLVVVYGLLFITTTEIGEVERGLSFYLRPFPKTIRQAAVRITLTIAFIPLILDRAHEFGEARKSRCGNQRKGTVRRIAGLAVPLMRHILDLGDEIGPAMAARGFTGEPRKVTPYRKYGAVSIFMLAAGAGIAGLLYLI